jgi:hypothetical protein
VPVLLEVVDLGEVEDMVLGAVSYWLDTGEVEDKGRGGRGEKRKKGGGGAEEVGHAAS